MTRSEQKARFPARLAWIAWTGPLLALAGCLQIETRISLHPDGSATITERVQFSQALLDLSAPGGGQSALAGLLERPAVADRLKHMGQGISLVSHEVRDAAGGSRESLAVFKIGDLREFRYASPFLAFSDYPANNLLKADLFPVYESTWYGRRAGQMAVTFSPVKPHKPEPQRKEGDPPPPETPPRTLQMLRNLQPLARDLLEGVRVKVTFESYAPLRFRMYFRYRNMSAGTHEFDLIDFTDKDLDSYGMNLVDNEEVMLELLQTRFNEKNLLETVKEHGTNMTLPVYHPRGVPEIYFKPSRQMFDAYFQGKMLKFDKNEGGERPANWDEIGYKGPADTARPEGPAARLPLTTGPDKESASAPAGVARVRPRIPGRRTGEPRTATTAPDRQGP